MVSDSVELVSCEKGLSLFIGGACCMSVIGSEGWLVEADGDAILEASI